MTADSGPWPRVPMPAPEQLAAWRLVVERLDHGDDSVVVPWLEVLRGLGLAPQHL